MSATCFWGSASSLPSISLERCCTWSQAKCQSQHTASQPRGASRTLHGGAQPVELGTPWPVGSAPSDSSNLMGLRCRLASGQAMPTLREVTPLPNARVFVTCMWLAEVGSGCCFTLCFLAVAMNLQALTPRRGK